MAAPSSSGFNPTLSGMPAVKTREEKAVEAAKMLMLQHRLDTGTIPTFDYVPLFTAIAERSVTLDFDNLGKLLADNAKGGRKTSQGGSTCHGNMGAMANMTSTGRPPKQPNDGCWDHVWYLPTWTDPDWDPDWEMLISGERQAQNQRDALTLRRPALRMADMVRDPTEYAKRFGTWPDRTDGRSRCSPATSWTRGYTGYYAQLELVPESERKLLEVETQRRIQGGFTMWDLRNGPVDPGVIDDWMAQQSFPSLYNMRMDAADKGMSYEDMVETLPPAVRTLYRPMMDEILADQDVQRIIFCDMTTDDLVANKIHTMSGDEKSNLTGPLHPLIDRNRWENTLWRGTEVKSPRFVYNLGGKRMEWDMQRNEELWTAMQPALQMVSRVLTSKPRFWTSLKDPSTRMTVPEANDPRTESELKASNLARLVSFAPWDEVYDASWPPAARLLKNMGFDFEKTMDYILMTRVEIGIASSTFDYEGEPTDTIYGMTWSVDVNGPTPSIHVSISADIIWPLLVREYSSSEKLCTSLIVATTLLHELMHATHMAQVMMLNGKVDLLPPGQSQASIDLLREVGKDIHDQKIFQEPYWRHHPFAELGFAFEEDWYGMQLGTFTDMSVNKMRSFEVQHAPILAGASTFPTDCTIATGKTLLAPMPSQRYGVGLPVDYFASFFMEAWWNTTFARYGQVAFQHLPPERSHWGIVVWDLFPQKTLYAVMGGEAQFRLFNLVVALLVNSGLNIVGRYLHEAMRDLCRAEALRASWETANSYWVVEESELSQMESSLSELAREADEQKSMFDDPNPHRLNQQYLQYAWQQMSPQATGNSPVLTYNDFVAAKGRALALCYSWGGRIQKGLMAMNVHLRTRVAVFQQLVFDFLTLSNTDRCRVFHHKNNAARFDDILAEVRGRIERYTGSVEATVIWCQNTAISVPGQLFEQWAGHYLQHHKMLVELQAILLNHHTIGDAQAQQIRRTFSTIPSGLDRPRSTRLRALALKEYGLLDSRIRLAVDEVNKMLHTVSLGQVDLFPAPVGPDDVMDQLAKLVTDTHAATVPAWNSGPPQPGLGPFAWKKPDAQKLAQYLPQQQQTQPVRAADMTPDTTTAAASPPAKANIVLATPAMTAAPWTRPINAADSQVQVPAGQGFAQYAVAPSTFAVPGSSGHDAGPSSFGGGAPAAPPMSYEDFTMYERNGLRPGLQPFGAPYADRTTVTSDLANVVPAPPSQLDLRALGLHMWRESQPDRNVDEDGDEIVTT